jgi:hypothetical protein
VKGNVMRTLVRYGVLVAAVGSSLLLNAPAAVAGGNGAVTFTQNDHNLVQVMNPGPPDFGSNPCTGDPATVTLTVNDVFHGTINKTGSWFTGTLEGTFLIVPVDSSLPTFSGHFATWFGDENNLRNDVEHSTFNVHGTGSDGSTLSLHDNAQATMNANGVITVSFDHFFCS